MMDFAFWIVLIIGAATLLLAVVILGAFAWASFRDWMQQPHAPSYSQGYNAALAKIEHDAWWFSESHETTQLFLDIARDGMNVSDARDKWRAARAAKEAAQ